MKSIKKYIIGLAAITSAIGFTACQDDFDDHKPGLDIPKATMTPNSTILEVKQAYWQNTVNYIDTIRTKPDGSHYIISGRVISSDRTGNVYKKLVIQDATAALAISVNQTGMYTKYAPGQEIVIDLTDMYIGKYNGTEQLGYPEFYQKTGVWEATFMPPVLLESHMELNGLPDTQQLDTITIRNFAELPTDPTLLPGIQSQLVRFNNVSFVEGGKKAFTDGFKVTTNRLITDAQGQTLTVRTSGYATFRDVMLPEGNGDVVALLDYYRTSDDSDSSPWQLTLIDAKGLMNFGNPTIEPGGEDNPYTVEQAIAIEQAGRRGKGWVTGYIVGAVAPDVTEVKSNADIEWGSEVVLANTLVIGPSADCKDFSKCLVIALPIDTKLREAGNLRDNPGNYGKQIWLYGSLDKYMSTWGITENSGATSQFRIEGVDVGGGETAKGDGTENSPFNVSQVIALNPTSTQEAVAGGAGVWVEGYIVGYMPSSPSTTLDNTVFGAPADLKTNIVLGPAADCKDYTQCIAIQLPNNAVRTALNLQDNPSVLGKAVTLYGDVMKYCSAPGLKNTSKYTLEGGGDTPNPPAGSTIYEGLVSNMDGWTVDNVTIPDAASYIWQWKEYNGSGYLNASCYISGTAYASEAYAYTAVDLSGKNDATLTFDHAAKFQTTLKTLCCLVVREAGSSAWTTLNIPEWPAAGAWTFASSGSISLKAYAGKKIEIGFKYGSSASGSDTWEIKNFLIKG